MIHCAIVMPTSPVHMSSALGPRELRFPGDPEDCHEHVSVLLEAQGTAVNGGFETHLFRPLE